MANVKATDLIEYTRASTGTYLDSDGTLKTAANNIPRIEYDADGNLLGLLIEESRTNQFIQSENFTFSAWGRARAVPVKDAVGPTGVANSAVTMSDNASGNSSSVYIQETVTGLTTGNDYTASVFAKKGSLNFLGLKGASLGLTGTQAYFDLANGTIGSVGSDLTATMKDYGNGWYRCSITFTARSDTSGTIRIHMWEQITGDNFLHDGTKNILIFGAQFEEGSFPTSYIKTTGSTATRSADVASIDVDQFGYNQNEGTLFADYRTFSTKATWREAITLTSTAVSPANYIVLRVDPSDEKDYQGYSANSLDFNLQTSGYSVGDSLKTAGAYKTNDFAASHDGNILTDASGNPPESVSILQIGRHFSSRYLNGHIKSIKYFPKRLSNAKLQELTS